jgi:hypothetical protein
MARDKTITTANAVLAISIPNLYPTAQLIQGFASDDAFDIDAIESAETQMGVDGKFAIGWIPKEVKQNIALLANSDSNSFFDQWYLANQAIRDQFVASGTIIAESVGVKLKLDNGALMSYMPLAPHKKVLQPRKYTIVWGRITLSNI